MEAKYVMAPVTMGCACQFIYTMYVNVEQYLKKTTGMALASVLAAAINVALNYVLIPKFGYLVAAYTTLIGYLCLMLMHMFLVKRIGMKNVYNNIIVLLCVACGIISMIDVVMSYSNMIFRG